MNLHIDASEFAPIIGQTVDAAIARILSERIENAQVPIHLSRAGAVKVATQPSLAELEQHVVTMRAARQCHSTVQID